MRTVSFALFSVFIVIGSTQCSGGGVLVRERGLDEGSCPIVDPSGPCVNGCCRSGVCVAGNCYGGSSAKDVDFCPVVDPIGPCVNGCCDPGAVCVDGNCFGIPIQRVVGL
jgi:hypothetical protein